MCNYHERILHGNKHYGLGVLAMTAEGWSAEAEIQKALDAARAAGVKEGLERAARLRAVATEIAADLRRVGSSDVLRHKLPKTVAECVRVADILEAAIRAEKGE